MQYSYSDLGHVSGQLRSQEGDPPAHAGDAAAHAARGAHSRPQNVCGCLLKPQRAIAESAVTPRLAPPIRHEAATRLVPLHGAQGSKIRRSRLGTPTNSRALEKAQSGSLTARRANAGANIAALGGGRAREEEQMGWQDAARRERGGTCLLMRRLRCCKAPRISRPVPSAPVPRANADTCWGIACGAAHAARGAYSRPQNVCGFSFVVVTLRGVGVVAFKRRRPTRTPAARPAKTRLPTPHSTLVMFRARLEALGPPGQARA
ncbi:hypothetical protein B0H10DRAFT_2308967 [Mycena sp. CBHHK59/15]|nr:hypothetical protein B0H10DRAFT_2308967 [Mycena sp. CBHHK59/15]